ncbi:MAG: aldehyde-activating protein [Hyphomicrobiales bacterium]|nr:MAG: aldehyde-activating protein [Hyphomicrobiales bacterium]
MSATRKHEDGVITGRCYCGASTVRASAPPTRISYCHCRDCRRFTGAPVAAFAAFAADAVSFSPNDGSVAPGADGVERTFCPQCGSPLAGRFDYLPGQVFVALGVLEQAEELVPEQHSYESHRLSWLHIEDDIERFDTSSRDRLNDSMK